MGVEELLVCGMMTQNCVTHTAISRSADKYAVTLLRDCCTTVSEAIHNFALHAVATRLVVADANAVLKTTGGGSHQLGDAIPSDHVLLIAGSE